MNSYNLVTGFFMRGINFIFYKKHFKKISVNKVAT